MLVFLFEKVHHQWRCALWKPLFHFRANLNVQMYIFVRYKGTKTSFNRVLLKIVIYFYSDSWFFQVHQPKCQIDRWTKRFYSISYQKNLFNIHTEGLQNSINDSSRSVQKLINYFMDMVWVGLGCGSVVWL